MTQGLPVSRLINVGVNLSPSGAQFQSFGTVLIVGDSDIIDVVERIRPYSSLSGVAADFGTTAPEYLAASLFFSQNPQPNQLLLGRWAQAATNGRLKCGPADTVIADWTAITAGGFKITVDGAGSPTAVTGLNFSGVTNMNGVASIISAALTGATCTWDGAKFVFKSSSTGTSSAIAYLTSPASGTDITTKLGGTAATGATLVPGIAAETALQALTILDGMATAWYMVGFASTHLVDADRLAVAGYIEGSGNAHLYALTTSSAAVLDPASTTDIAYLLKAAGYNRTFTQYSWTTPYAKSSALGRAATVDFSQSNSAITLMFKQEPGVVAESLAPAQIAALEGKNCNVFVSYNNGTAILEPGVMASGVFFDEMQGIDWLRNQIQTNVYNLMETSPTKLPQTDAGMHLIANAIEAALAQGVTNGVLAPGTWNEPGFGQIKQGDFLPKGYYVYAPPITSQAQSDRAARKSVPFQVAAKLAGAVHSVAIAVNVNA